MDSKSECIALAKKKLRDYQNKHRRKSLDDVSLASPSVSSSTEINDRKSNFSCEFAHNETKSEIVQIGDFSQSLRSSIIGITKKENQPSFFEKNFGADSHSEALKAEELSVEDGTTLLANDLEVQQRYNWVSRELNEVIAERDHLREQLSNLHGYYSDLHAAYTKLNDCLNNGNGSDNSSQVQLLQLKNALSLIVNEKTELQQQLRESKEIADRRLMENQTLFIDLNDKQSKILTLESDFLANKKELDSVHAILLNQTKELEINRKELTDWQSRLLHVQQDRNEAQERLKYTLKEAENLQTELDEARKQLKLKEIYLRQISAYNNALNFNEDSVTNLHEEIERLKNEIVVSKKAAENWKEQARLAQEHFEACGAKLNQNLCEINEKLNDALNEKFVLESKAYALENEVKVLKWNAERENRPTTEVNIADSQLKNEQNEQRLQELEAIKENLRLQINALDEENSQLKRNLSEMSTKLTDKTKELESNEESLIRLQETFEEQRKFNEEVRELSGRLQNEKATVSRALAQNRELKEQLIELQDKVVFLSEQNMEKESNRLSALHIIDQLKLEIEMISAEKQNSSDPSNSDLLLQNTDEVVPSQRMKYEEKCCETENSAYNCVEMAEAELARANQDLGIMRNEFRRVNQENEELRRIMEQNAEDENQNSIIVELNQAIARINVLSAENEQLRQRLQSVNSEIPTEVSSDDENGSCRSKKTSEIDDFNQIMQKPLAWVELEARFARAMRQNADLIEHSERLEHIITELQSENDTIGEYVTIYQHQRKVIKERMRQREEAVAQLSLEKTKMQRKLNDLQQSLLNLFSKKGLLHLYDHNRSIDSMKATKPSYKIVKRANKMRAFSESIVDETTGSEHFVVNGHDEQIPDVHLLQTKAKTGLQDGNESFASYEPGEINGFANNEEDSSVTKIMKLIKELQEVEQSRMHYGNELCVHCNECSGNLIRL